MIDETLDRDPKADPRANWARMRDRMREIIHAELDRFHPTDDARRALELIIESSVRPSEADGAVTLTVIDHEGRPRTAEKDGAQAPFTLEDLLDELRVKYPVLFRPAKPAAGSSAGPDEAPAPRVAPERDWLSLAPAEPARPTGTPEPPAAPRGSSGAGTSLSDWSRARLETFKASVMPARAGGPTRDGERREADDRERAGGGDANGRFWKRPAVALGAVAVLALLGVGAALFRGDDAPTPQATVAASGPAGPIREPEPTVTGSTGSAGALRGVPDVIDTATLSLNGEVVRLFGVEWAPGAGKPEDLTQYLNGREVACDPAGANDVYRCLVGGQDLSRVVLFNGGGRPTGDATPELRAAADKAREAKVGVWSKPQP